MEFYTSELDDFRYCSISDASKYMDIPENTVLRWAIQTYNPYTFVNGIKTPDWCENDIKLFDSDKEKFFAQMAEREDIFRIPESTKDFVFVVRKNAEQEVILERYAEDYWKEARDIVTEENILYVTKDIRDSELTKYNFPTIIWKRYNDKDIGRYRKIVVPFTPDDIDSMEKQAAQIWLDCYIDQRDRMIAANKKKADQKKAKENYKETRFNIESTYNLFVTDSEEDRQEALKKWIDEGMKMPAPYIISDIKKDMYPNLSWKEFKEEVGRKK